MDINDLGRQILSDNEIIRTFHEEDDTEGKENKTDDLTESKNGPSHSDYFNALNLAFKWFERQKYSNTTQLLQLRKLRDITALNRWSTMMQINFFQNKIKNVSSHFFFKNNTFF